MKKLVLTLTIATFATVASCFLTSFDSNNSIPIEVHLHETTGSEGSHCNSTVGCSCSGFAPITNGKVWQKSYCRNCGHSKSSHR